MGTKEAIEKMMNELMTMMEAQATLYESQTDAMNVMMDRICVAVEEMAGG